MTRREHSPGLKGAILAATGPLFLSLTQFSGPSDTAKAREVDGDWGLEREGEAKAAHDWMPPPARAARGAPMTLDAPLLSRSRLEKVGLGSPLGFGNLSYQPLEPAHPAPAGSEPLRRRAGEARAAQAERREGAGRGPVPSGSRRPLAGPRLHPPGARR